MNSRLNAPFPYYGGKGRWAAAVWRRFGQPAVYLEPFFGSGAVLLAHAEPCLREVVCDLNGVVCNVWRALRTDLEQVAHWADYPTIHQDLTARPLWLRRWGQEHHEQLSTAPDWYDAKAVGWWLWGASLWIGAGWCQVDHEKRLNLDDTGRRRGVAQVPYVPSRPGDKGVSQQTLHVHEQIPQAGPNRLLPWFTALSQRLQQVIVLNRPWKSALSPTIWMDTTTSPPVMRPVFLDPPYLLAARGSVAGQAPHGCAGSPPEAGAGSVAV